MKKYSFREFAKMGHTTIRTLRYYESMGLFLPIIDNGVKYIEESFLVQLQTILLLKKVGYRLEEIKYIVNNKNIEEQIILQKDLLNIQLTDTKTMLSLIEELQTENTLGVADIYAKFIRIQNKKNLQLQFETTEGLKKRVLFHHKHTHFKENFHEWMFKHYEFHSGDKVLEIGCGDGTLWQCNMSKIPKDIEITLSDVSQKMINESYEKLKNIPQIKSYDDADCFQLPYEDKLFDVVIVNHVLMYFDNLELALSEINRVLKNDGVLYCSTIAKDMMKERDEMLRYFDPKISFDQELLYTRFGYENGEQKLSQYFHDIELFDHKEEYKIKDMDLFYDFILSGMGLSTNLEPLYRKKVQFYEYLKNYFIGNNFFNLTIHAGMFKAKKENGRDGKCKGIDI